jgi:hypothetical protein
MLHHTLIVGQSGSGKSFFVARLIEEILTRTGARVVALDPNGDLRNLDGIEMSGIATKRKAMDSAAKKVGLQPLDNLADFTERWAAERIVFLNSAERRPTPQNRRRAERSRLVLDWATMDDDQDALLGLDSHQRPTQLLGVKACRSLVEYAQTGKGSYFPDSLRGLAMAADMFAGQNVNMQRYEYAKHLTSNDWSSVRARFLDLISQHQVWTNDPRYAADRIASNSLTDFVDAAFDAPGTIPDWNALIIGLDTARQPDALLAASVTLGRLWKDAKDQARRATNDDQRVPTFVVIDEAHNFVPAHTDDSLRRRVSEKILQIASEGRKYGLYLILATQRPTKLHPELVPECENSCVLRVQSDRELKFAAETLGIPNNRVEGAARFVQGQGLLSGRWVDGGVVDVLAAPARSHVGGGGLGSAWTEGPRVVEMGDLGGDAFDPERVEPVRKMVLDLLHSSPTALVLTALADALRMDPSLACGPANGWMGFGTLKNLIEALSIDNLELETRKPGFAYIAGMHPVPEPDGEDELTPVPVGLAKIRLNVDVPLLRPSRYRSIFEALADELAVNPYRMSDTGKAVRDSLHESGIDVGRGSINFILKGISLAGHDFSSDQPQDPETLATAFATSLLEVSGKGSGLSPMEEREVRDWITKRVDVTPLVADDQQPDVDKDDGALEA